MVTEHYFYRQFDSSNFKKSKPGSLSTDSNFIMVKKNIQTKYLTCFCPVHNIWETVQKVNRHNVITNCSYEIKGIPEIYPEYAPQAKNILLSRQLEHSLWNSITIKGKTYTDTQNKFITFCQETEEIPSSSDFLYDENCIPYSLVGIRILIDYDNFIFTTEQIFLDTKKIESKSHNFNTKLPLLKNSTRYKLTTGTVQNLNNMPYFPVSSKSSEKLFLSLLEKWAGRSLSTNLDRDKVDFYKALTQFPYEPNLSQIYNHRELDFSLKNELWDLRQIPDCFNRFCQILNITPYRTFRKNFAKNPLLILTYKALLDCGFKDKNIINSFFTSPAAPYFYSSESVLVIFFVRHCLEHKTERSTLRLLEKSINSVFFADSIYMFQQYFPDIPEDILLEIYRNGLTDYYHDVLSNIGLQIEEKNVEFEYTKQQKSLEDEIDGYSFKLPVDYNKLKELGTELHNCVSSYKNRVIQKNCTIVYAQKDGTARICIEIREDQIHQQRIDYNQDPKGPDLAVMEEYQKRHNLKFSGNRY